MKYFKLIFLFTSFTVAQLQVRSQYADKSFYLLDSLEYEKLSDYNKNILDSDLTEYHQVNSDSAKSRILAHIAYICTDDVVWIRYNDFLLKFALEKIKTVQSKELKDYFTNEVGIAYGNIGYYKKNRGEIATALEYYFKALKVYETVHDTEGIATQYNNASLVYWSLGDTNSAVSYTLKSLQLYQKIDNKEGIGTALINLALLQSDVGQLDSAITNLKKANELFYEINEIDGIASSYCNLGNTYAKLKDYEKGLFYNFKGLENYKKIGFKGGISNTYSNLAVIFQETNAFQKAKLYGDSALQIGIAYDFPQDAAKASEILYQIHKKNKNWKIALEMYEFHNQLKDSLNNNKIQRVAGNKQAQYEYEKKQAISDIEHQKELAIAKEAKKRHQIVIIMVIGMLLLVVIFLYTMYKRLKISKKKNRIIAAQKGLVIEKSREIADSINYAKRIQEAMLPDKILADLFDNAALLYLPKDIVSGDFYWLERKDNLHFFCVADCTGHGVPGGFMSMIGTILLNEIFNSKKLYEPATVLEELNRLLVISLQKKGVTLVKDGMDISFACYNSLTMELQWSGANNPLWIVSSSTLKTTSDFRTQQKENDSIALHEIKANKRPIGYYDYKTTPFENHTIQLKKGDAIYLFSDGYIDQFGGENGRKFMSKRLKTLLLNTHLLSKKEQFDVLKKSFNDWKVGQEQIDDVCIIGVGL